MIRVRSAALIVLLLVVCPASASATTIGYEVTNLGGNLWQYEYFPSDRVFQQGEGFAVFFDYTLYSDLALGAPTPNDWDPLVVERDLVLQSDGVYDALALVTNPSLAGPFRVSFRWLGLDTPPSQPFEIYEDGDPLNTIETGQTVLPAAVPEPSSILLLLTGAAFARTVRRRRPRLTSRES